MLNSAWLNAVPLNQATPGRLVLFESSFSASASLQGAATRHAGMFSGATSTAVGSGELRVTVDLASAASAQALATGYLLYTAPLGGTLAATASLGSSGMTPIKPLACVFSGTASFFGDMSRDALYSNFSGEAVLVGTIDPRRLFGGSASASASFAPVDFTVYGLMGSEFVGSAGLFGELSANSTLSMSGSMSATATLALDGTEWVSVPMAGTFDASAALAGEIVIRRRMPSGAAGAAASLEGSLGRRARLDATVAASASGVGSLTKQRLLGGSALAQAQMYGAPSRRAVLSGAAQAAATLASASVWYVAAGAAFSAEATGSGSLYARVFMSGMAAASAVWDGDLLLNPGTIPPADRAVTAVSENDILEALFESMTVQVM